MAWCFQEEADRYSEGLLERLADEVEAVVSSLWPYEVANVLLVAERNKRITPAQAALFVQLLGSLPIRVDSVEPIRSIGEVLEVARTYGLSAYDASYLELAIRIGAPLGTRDRRLASAARRAGVPAA